MKCCGSDEATDHVCHVTQHTFPATGRSTHRHPTVCEQTLSCSPAHYNGEQREDGSLWLRL